MIENTYYRPLRMILGFFGGRSVVRISKLGVYAHHGHREIACFIFRKKIQYDDSLGRDVYHKSNHVSLETRRILAVKMFSEQRHYFFQTYSTVYCIL